jgi:hypothetical protein
MSWNSTDTEEIRKFGFIALIFFGCLCGLGIWKQKVLPIYIFGLLSVLGFGFILIPRLLRPIYTSWLKIAHFVGRKVTSLILAFAYYLVITPSALLKRLFTGTPLPIKPDKRASTYWVDRSETLQPKERYTKRY